MSLRTCDLWQVWLSVCSLLPPSINEFNSGTKGLLYTGHLVLL